MNWPVESSLNPMLLINGECIPGNDGTKLEVHNPSTGEILGEIHSGTTTDIDHAVVAAKSALEGSWRDLEPKEREQCLFLVAEHIRMHLDELVILESLDSGKPTSSARRSVLRAQNYFIYFGSLCDKIQGVTIPRGRKRFSFTQLEPVGVTGHITPWNAPLTAMARGVAPRARLWEYRSDQTCRAGLAVNHAAGADYARRWLASRSLQCDNGCWQISRYSPGDASTC